MRRMIPLAVGAVVIAGLALRAQQAPPQQPPVFRGGADLIRLDVSVLDKNRRPIKGLTPADFTIYEDGKPQRLVAVSEIGGENDPAPSAWMRQTARDVASNDLADQAGDGRVFAIVMDDWNIPYDAHELILSAREIGRYIVDAMRPSDVAAVVFPQDAGKTQDFTDDREKLLRAIDKFQPPDIQWVEPTPYGTSNGGGDMPYRYSSALARSTCERKEPLVPVLETLTSRLVAIQNRRKTVVVVSTGAAVSLAGSGGSGCAAKLHDIMYDVFYKAMRSNINIYGIDPGGEFGYANYLNDPILRARRGMSGLGGRPNASGGPALRHDFLRIMAESTGARAIGRDDDWGDIDDLLAESESYYLVGYQTSNGKPDGKFHKVEVKVNRPGAIARTRSGYYAPREGDLSSPERKILPHANDLGLSGMDSPASLPLRASATPVSLAAGGRNADVAVVLTIRLPAPLKDMAETVTIVRNVYDADSVPGPPVQEKRSLTLHPVTGDDLRYDVLQKLTLAPGRYQIRYNATSTALDESGSIYADLEVPDFTRTAVSATPIVLGMLPASGQDGPDVLGAILPIVPTSAREFSVNDHVTAFLRIFQGGAATIAPVDIAAQVLDVKNAKVLDTSSTLAPESFDPTRGAPFELALPLAGLPHGPYLLSVTATLRSGATARRDLVFRVR